ncbi:MAG: [FeFe] hydrogenase H-cluster radical SAM maturase HydG [Candidatus Omnitrophota bacterium]
MSDIIDEGVIWRILGGADNPGDRPVASVIRQAEKKKGLCPQEAAVLLSCRSKRLWRRIYGLAHNIKKDIYGDRLVLFAPLYLSNACRNNCLYCGFRRDNRGFPRKTLTMPEVAEEVKLLEGRGHKRLLLVCGEGVPLGYIKKAISLIYKTGSAGAKIRRVNVNIAPLSREGFRQLKRRGIGTYQLFQETYHLPTYKKMHPCGPKADYHRRLRAIDKAIEAGIDDVGLGVLFGLYDWRFETLALLLHIGHLERRFGIGPHTISVPRLEPAPGSFVSQRPPYPVGDEQLKMIVAVLRLAVPYTGIILSTRERASLRNELFSLGVSQISVGSSTRPGGYSRKGELSQFELGDKRSLSQVIAVMLKQGLLPSFCTACYRLGRTGRVFMSLAQQANIHNFCLPNCLLTFYEYVLDYAGDRERRVAERAIFRRLRFISDDLLREETESKLRRLRCGERDLCF